MIRTNVIGAMATVDAAAEHFLARGSGQVVRISSLASQQPIKEQEARRLRFLPIGLRRSVTSV